MTTSRAVAGIDVGSRSIELVVREAGRELERLRVDTTFDAAGQCTRLLAGRSLGHVVATGYGRDLVARLGLPAPVKAVTEIKAHALGAADLFPHARTVLDIGGQDTKAISLSPAGKPERFEMNDRCAAGTGKFLEYTARAFGLDVEHFGPFALQGSDPPVIGSMCTVFAETEATSLMARGVKPENIALGLHQAIVTRTSSMLRRVGLAWPLVFVGGVARNPCVVRLLAEKLEAALGETLLVPEQPEMTGALGAALLAERNISD